MDIAERKRKRRRELYKEKGTASTEKVGAKLRKRKDAKVKEENDYIQSLSKKEYALHKRKRKYLNRTYRVGSEAALARGRKSMETMRKAGHKKLNGDISGNLTSRQTEMLKETFYEDAIQVGTNAMWAYLKKTYPDDKTPTQRNILRWLKEQPKWQIN